MLKKLTSALALLALCLMAGTAMAGVMSFAKFKITVPDGWTATQDGTTVGIVANDNSAAISITIDGADGASAKDLAAAFSKEMKGTKPKRDKDGDYEFTCKNANGIESDVFVSVDNDEFMLTMVTGEHPQLRKILNSIKYK